jgi:hypothetical protein
MASMRGPGLLVPSISLRSLFAGIAEQKQRKLALPQQAQRRSKVQLARAHLADPRFQIDQQLLAGINFGFESVQVFLLP